MSRCKSCNAEIIWMKTFSGKSIPVNSDEVSFVEGGKELFVTDGDAVIRGTRTSEQGPAARRGYVSHFATCPNAAFHRKKRRS